MKKTAFILLALVVMLFAITSVASAASSKSDYCAEIFSILDRVNAALEKGNKSAAESAVADLRGSVYGLARVLAAAGEYSPSVLNIVDFAEKALSDSVNFKSLMAQAYESANVACTVVPLPSLAVHS